MAEHYADAVRAGKHVELPEDKTELYELAMRAICSEGVPSHLTGFGSMRAIAAFAIGHKGDPWYRDGEVLLKATVAVLDPVGALPKAHPDGGVRAARHGDALLAMGGSSS